MTPRSNGRCGSQLLNACIGRVIAWPNPLVATADLLLVGVKSRHSSAVKYASPFGRKRCLMLARPAARAGERQSNPKKGPPFLRGNGGRCCLLAGVAAV